MEHGLDENNKDNTEKKYTENKKNEEKTNKKDIREEDHNKTRKKEEISLKEHNKPKFDLKLKNFLSRLFEKNYKILLVITISLMLLNIAVIGVHYAVTGDIVNKGIDIKGGVSITINKDINPDDTKLYLKQAFPKSDIRINTILSSGKVIAVTIEATDVSEKELLEKIKDKVAISENDYVVESVGTALGSSFFRQTVIALVAAFILMAIVVLITFRNFYPSFFVMLCAAADMLATWAVVVLSGMRLSSAGVAAFLMMVGYSIDTDILLTTRVLKHKEGSLHERIMQAMKTGVTMSLTSAAATLIAYFATPSPALKEIMFILTTGLLFDIIFTWGQNATILRWYLERKENMVR